MEPHSSSSSLLSFSVEKPKTKYYNSSLHSTRKTSPPAKITKKPIAPLPPIPPRVYLIDPSHFKEAVQQLTAAPEFQSSSRLQKLAPPRVAVMDPLDELMSNDIIMNRVQVQLPCYNMSSASCSAVETSFESAPSWWFGNLSSPSSNGWLSSSVPVFSPGTISAFELNTIL